MPKTRHSYPAELKAPRGFRGGARHQDHQPTRQRIWRASQLGQPVEKTTLPGATHPLRPQRPKTKQRPATRRADRPTLPANRTAPFELDWLKKKLRGLAWSVEPKRAQIEIDHPQISLARQCELLGLARSSFYYQSPPNPQGKRTTTAINRALQLQRSKRESRLVIPSGRSLRLESSESYALAAAKVQVAATFAAARA